LPQHNFYLINTSDVLSSPFFEGSAIEFWRKKEQSDVYSIDVKNVFLYFFKTA